MRYKTPVALWETCVTPMMVFEEIGHEETSLEETGRAGGHGGAADSVGGRGGRGGRGEQGQGGQGGGGGGGGKNRTGKRRSMMGKSGGGGGGGGSSRHESHESHEDNHQDGCVRLTTLHRITATAVLELLERHRHTRRYVCYIFLCSSLCSVYVQSMFSLFSVYFQSIFSVKVSLHWHQWPWCFPSFSVLGAPLP